MLTSEQIDNVFESQEDSNWKKSDSEIAFADALFGSKKFHHYLVEACRDFMGKDKPEDKARNFVAVMGMTLHFGYLMGRAEATAEIKSTEE